MNSTEAFDTIREILRKLSARESSKLLELVDVLNAAGLNELHKSYYNQDPYINMQQLQPNDGSIRYDHSGCVEGKCQHKEELNRLDMFYNEVFFE